jgi:undecaprenyl-diphosphatase
MLNIKREQAAEFSFLLSIPSIIGAIILKYNEINIISPNDLKYYFISAIVAFFVGLFSIYIVINIVKYAKFKFFALYCLIIGIYTVIWL